MLLEPCHWFIVPLRVSPWILKFTALPSAQDSSSAPSLTHVQVSGQGLMGRPLPTEQGAPYRGQRRSAAVLALLLLLGPAPILQQSLRPLCTRSAALDLTVGKAVRASFAAGSHVPLIRQ
ncbi:hypothetical protein NDU88_007221 [Pleurodeles waltl]|uniref:Uncharacterized protein n=1 Tax=Pleurodeles waltl TaxID=8319 RepID=A0AAV7NVP1_PLEWA|nr:hypothetical protein NDU88_007221 [Pleurodeles waltl]